MPKTLEYRSLPMSSSAYVLPNSSTPRTVTEIRDRLLRGQVCHIYLEPGDATRYEMVLVPGNVGDQTYLMVIRVRSGESYGSYIIWHWEKMPGQFHLKEAAARVGGGNEWTEVLLHWWLTELCELNTEG